MLRGLPCGRRAVAAALSLPLLTACAPEPQQGLILSISSFKDNQPQPAEMLLVRPGGEGEPWSTEDIVERKLTATVALGDAPDGGFVMADIGDDDEPTGEPFTWMFDGSEWKRDPVAGLTLEDVTWQRNDEGALKTKDYELAGGNVFHKAMWFEPEYGAPGILTISANMPSVKIWRKKGKSWVAESLWSQPVGSKEHRYRDVEVGDVDGDGADELVFVTHDEGKVFVLEQKADGLESTLVASRDTSTFVHEVELGDVDGDGKAEIFTTPSDPNKFDGTHQRGQVERIDHEGETWTVRTLVDSETTHAKEILLTDIEGDGQLELYAAMEGEGLSGLDSGAEGASTRIQRFDFAGDDSTSEVVAELPSDMCRFLNAGDIDGDGQTELLASTKSDGIFRINLEGGEWTSRAEVSPLQSGGFEHSTVVFDWDGDGDDEIFAADDGHKRLLMFHWDTDRDRLKRRTLLDRKDAGSYFTWGVMPLPAAE